MKIIKIFHTGHENRNKLLLRGVKMVTIFPAGLKNRQIFRCGAQKSTNFSMRGLKIVKFFTAGLKNHQNFTIIARFCNCALRVEKLTNLAHRDTKPLQFSFDFVAYMQHINFEKNHSPHRKILGTSLGGASLPPPLWRLWLLSLEGKTDDSFAPQGKIWRFLSPAGKFFSIS